MSRLRTAVCLLALVALAALSPAPARLDPAIGGASAGADFCSADRFSREERTDPARGGPPSPAKPHGSHCPLCSAPGDSPAGALAAGGSHPVVALAGLPAPTWTSLDAPPVAMVAVPQPRGPPARA